MCPVYSVNDVTGLYLTPALSQREREKEEPLKGEGDGVITRVAFLPALRD
jgi:hypothetical protein